MKKPTTRTIKCPLCNAPAGKACRSIKSGKPLADDHAWRHLISINDAVKMGHPRLRKPVWANKFDHLKIDIINGSLGPWLHLYAPFNQECNGRDPVDILVLSEMASFDSREFEIYDGPLPASEEYKSEVARFARQVVETA